MIGNLTTNREKLQYTLTFLIDMFASILSAFLAWLLFDHLLNLVLPYTYNDRMHFYGLLFMALLTTFLCFDQTENITRRNWQGELKLTVLFNGIALAIFTTLMVITKAEMINSRYLIIGTFLINLILMMTFHQFLKKYLHRPDTIKSLATLVGVVSSSDRVGDLLNGLKGDWTKRIHGVALLDGEEKQRGSEIDGFPVMAIGTEFLDWIRRDSLDEIYIDVSYDTGESLLPYLTEMESMGVSIHLNVPLLEKLNKSTNQDDMTWYPRLSKSVEEYGKVPMITLSATQASFGDIVLKRCFDIVGSIVGLIISVPLIALVAIPLKLESPGPLFFKQKRVGLNGRYFYIYKIRSMYMDAEERKKELMAKNEMNGLMFKMTDDPRITKVGKFIRKTSIDEFPQFWNVLKGEMSLVGTRPPTLDEYNQYESHHKRRLSMKPGITGMWQVSGRSNIEDFEDVVKLDVAYIDNWTLWLDLKILFKTVAVVFAHKGAK